MPPAREQRPPYLVVATVTLAIMLLWPAWLAARNGLSDLYARPAIDYLEQKRFGAYSVSEAEWLAIESSVMHANKLMPHNPRYLASLGWLHQLKLALFADELSVEEMDFHANAAAEYFQQSVENRPTWPYYWGNLAMEHYRLGRYDAAEYSLALANASRFGPWKNDTQRLVFDIGSETWEFLTPAAQHELILNVERGLHRQPHNTIRIVQSYGAWPTLCTTSTQQLDMTLHHLKALCAQKRFSE